MIHWQETQDKEKFKAIADVLCSKDEARYSLLYGIILDPDVFGQHLMLHFGHEALALQTSLTRPLIVTDLTLNQARELAKWLDQHPEISEIVGTKETINLILDNLRSNSGNYPELIMDQRIYLLEKDKFNRPDIKHNIRHATPKDLPLVTEWFYQFMHDALAMPNPDRTKIKPMALKRIEKNEVYLLVKDGNPVSMACSNRPTPNGITVNGVFTPIEQRGCGYATEAVALLSQKLLQIYQFCCLYTDLSNPTSNKIYTTIGYQPICDSLQYKIKFDE
jgi:uncharacterized protein